MAQKKQKLFNLLWKGGICLINEKKKKQAECCQNKRVYDGSKIQIIHC